MAMPWTPVGRPNRNSDRMTAKSGLRSMPPSKWITDSGRVSRQTPYELTIVLLMTVPNAAPMVPNIGMRITFKPIVTGHRQSESQRGTRIPAARNAPLSMKNMIKPTMPTNIMRRNGSASARTSGAAFTSVSSQGAAM